MSTVCGLINGLTEGQAASKGLVAVVDCPQEQQSKHQAQQQVGQPQGAACTAAAPGGSLAAGAEAQSRRPGSEARQGSRLALAAAASEFPRGSRQQLIRLQRQQQQQQQLQVAQWQPAGLLFPQSWVTAGPTCARRSRRCQKQPPPSLLPRWKTMRASLQACRLWEAQQGSSSSSTGTRRHLASLRKRRLCVALSTWLRRRLVPGAGAAAAGAAPTPLPCRCGSSAGRRWERSGSRQRQPQPCLPWMLCCSSSCRGTLPASSSPAAAAAAGPAAGACRA